MVRADLQSLIPAHDETGLAGLLVLEDAHVAGAALLPLGVGLDEAEELGAPAMSAMCSALCVACRAWGLCGAAHAPEERRTQENVRACPSAGALGLCSPWPLWILWFLWVASPALQVPSTRINNAHLEDDLLVLLVGLGLDRLGEADDGLELGVVLVLASLLESAFLPCPKSLQRPARRGRARARARSIDRPPPACAAQKSCAA